MDPDTRDALAEIKLSIRDGFESVERRIDHLVTRAEFVAEVRRIDSDHGNLKGQHESLRSDFSRHLDQTTEIIEANRSADAAIAKEAKESIANVRADLHTQLDGFRAQSRWAVGIAVTLAGLVFGIISWAIAAF